MILNIPILLTLLRIGLIPIFIVVFYLPWHWAPPVSALIFMSAGITDWADGFLARRWKQTSRFGAFLDPVADKLMVASALVMLVEQYASPWMTIPAIIIIGREITVSALREWMAEVGEGRKVAVAFVGKLKTATQILALVFLLYQWPLYGVNIRLIGLILLYMASIFTLASMFKYLTAAFKA